MTTSSNQTIPFPKNYHSLPAPSDLNINRRAAESHERFQKEFFRNIYDGDDLADMTGPQHTRLLYKLWSKYTKAMIKQLCECGDQSDHMKRYIKMWGEVHSCCPIHAFGSTPGSRDAKKGDEKKTKTKSADAPSGTNDPNFRVWQTGTCKRPKYCPWCAYRKAREIYQEIKTLGDEPITAFSRPYEPGDWLHVAKRRNRAIRMALRRMRDFGKDLDGNPVTHVWANAQHEWQQWDGCKRTWSTSSTFIVRGAVDNPKKFLNKKTTQLPLVEHGTHCADDFIEEQLPKLLRFQSLYNKQFEQPKGEYCKPWGPLVQPHEKSMFLYHKDWDMDGSYIHRVGKRLAASKTQKRRAKKYQQDAPTLKAKALAKKKLKAELTLAAESGPKPVVAPTPAPKPVIESAPKPALPPVLQPPPSLTPAPKPLPPRESDTPPRDSLESSPLYLKLEAMRKQIQEEERANASATSSSPAPVTKPVPVSRPPFNFGAFVQQYDGQFEEQPDELSEVPAVVRSTPGFNFGVLVQSYPEQPDELELEVGVEVELEYGLRLDPTT